MVRFIELIEPILRLVPTVSRPTTPITMSTRLLWTFMAVTVFLLMSMTPLYGVDVEKVPPYFNPLAAMIFATTSGTLMHLGIGPLIISGIILEVLIFSGILNVNLNDPTDQARFNALYKSFALFIAFGETLIFIKTGQLGPITAFSAFLITIQLLFATLIIILLDDLITKGWGIGSGISLFIMVGILKTIFWWTFSPIIPPNAPFELPFGILPAMITGFHQAFVGNFEFLSAIAYGFARPTVTGLIATIVIVAVILYVEMFRVSIPLTITQYRGLKYTLPLRLMYVSVLPIIFTAFSLSLIQHMFQALWFSINPENVNPALNWLVCMREIEGGMYPCEGSLMYYLWSSSLPNITPQFVIAHVILYVVLATIFAYLWVNIAGMTAEDQAKRIVQSGLHIPGFRPSVKIIAKYLHRYIIALTITSGVIAGLIAATGDLLGVFAGGIGLLLLVEIILQYYSLALRERLFEVYPMLKKFVERE